MNALKIIIMLVFVAGCSDGNKPLEHAEDVAVDTFVDSLASERQWHTFHGDTTLSGFADGRLSDRMVRLWRVKVAGEVLTTPVVLERVIYCVAGACTVVALDMNGRRLWQSVLDVGGDSMSVDVSAPLLAVSGLVVCAMDDGWVVALDAKSGKEKWRYRVAGGLMGAPNYIAKDFSETSLVVVVDRQNGVVHAINSKTGKNVWIAAKTARCDGSVSVGNGKVVFGSCAATVHVLSAETGELLGEVALGEGSEMAGSIAVVGDRLYAGNRSGAMVCFDAVGYQVVWTNTDGEGELFLAPAVTRDVVVFSSNDGNVYAVSSDDGQQRWRYDLDSTDIRAPIIVGDKVVVVVGDGVISVLSLVRGEKIWSYHLDDDVTSVAYAYGRLIVGAGTGEVVVFGAE